LFSIVVQTRLNVAFSYSRIVLLVSKYKTAHPFSNETNCKNYAHFSIKLLSSSMKFSIFQK